MKLLFIVGAIVLATPALAVQQSESSFQVHHLITLYYFHTFYISKTECAFEKTLFYNCPTAAR